MVTENNLEKFINSIKQQDKREKERLENRENERRKNMKYNSDILRKCNEKFIENLKQKDMLDIE